MVAQYRIPGIQSHRLPTSIEVMDQFRQLGAAAPTDIGTTALYGFLDLARSSIDPSEAAPWRTKDELVGAVHYELGIATHGSSATHHLTQARGHLGKRTSYQPYEQQGRQLLFGIVDLLRARNEQPEQSLSRHETVRKFGDLIATGLDQLDTLTSNQRPIFMAQMIKLAFAATFLTGQDTYIGAPTTVRQRSPLRRLATGDRTRGNNERPLLEDTSFNLLGYVTASSELVSVTRVRTRNTGSDGDYDPSILLLYADRHLRVRDVEELRRYGQRLREYRGKPSSVLWRALNNIGAAQEDHHSRVKPEQSATKPAIGA